MGAPGTTLGLWRVRENPRHGPEVCDLSICGDIFVLADLTGPQYEHQIPNAHQMAASGALYDALEALAQAASGYPMSGVEFEERRIAAFEALAVARGETPSDTLGEKA